MLEQVIIASGQIIAAYRTYNEHFDPELYTAAVRGRTVEYGNALIDEAMALCGHPQYKLSDRIWPPEARTFLICFRKEDPRERERPEFPVYYDAQGREHQEF